MTSLQIPKRGLKGEVYIGKLEMSLLELYSSTWKQLPTSTAALPDLQQDF